MNAQDLKIYIINNNKTEFVLEQLNCTHIKHFRDEIRFGYDDIGSGAIRIKKDTLATKSYSTKNEFQGDIFTLVEKLKEIPFTEAIRWLHNVLNLAYNGTYMPPEQKKDILAHFKLVKPKKYNIEHLKEYDESILNNYISIPNMLWVRDGITPTIQKEFGIGYDIKSNRIVIPHRKWDTGKIVGIIGRTLNQNYQILDIPKYFPLIAYQKSQNLYGLYENYEHIKKLGYVNVFESEKSVLKMASKLDRSAVSLSGHSLSDTQVKILISLNVDIILQMDKDVPIEKVYSMCEMLKGVRNVYYVEDDFNLLKNKESPADAIKKVYTFLWNRKKRY